MLPLPPNCRPEDAISPTGIRPSAEVTVDQQPATPRARPDAGRCHRHVLVTSRHAAGCLQSVAVGTRLPMNTPPALSDLPADLADRPFDPEFGLPIPFVNEFDDGSYEFGAINRRRSIQCALSRLCGMCGTSLEYDIAFLGGPKAAESRAYTDPPMHVACAEAALHLCPHLHQHTTPPGDRSGDESETRRRLRRGVTTADLFTADRPSEWVLYLTHNFEIERATAEGGGLVLVFHPGASFAERHFRFESGSMRELG